MNHPCEDHSSRDCGVCHRPVRVTTDTLPADCEGELRDLARELRVNLSFVSDRLEAIINRYSGLRPMRTGNSPEIPDGSVALAGLYRHTHSAIGSEERDICSRCGCHLLDEVHRRANQEGGPLSASAKDYRIVRAALVTP